MPSLSPWPRAPGQPDACWSGMAGSPPSARPRRSARWQPDPAGRAFGADSQGRLDGVVYEGPMFALFERSLRHDIARMGAAERASLVEMAGQRFAAFGVTSACDADLRRDTFAAFAEADDSGVLNQRIYGLVVHDEVDWLLASGLRGRHSDRLPPPARQILGR